MPRAPARPPALAAEDARRHGAPGDAGQPDASGERTGLDAVRLAAAYVVVATAWIVVSGLVLRSGIVSAPTGDVVEIAKGIAFVLVTAGALYLVLARRSVAIRRHQTALVAANTALAATTSNLEAIIDATPLPMYTLDRAGRVLRWNPAAARVFGWQADEVLGRPVPMVTEDAEPEYADHRARVLRGETVHHRAHGRVAKDGRSLTLDLWAAPLWDSSGAITGLLVISEDLTAQQATEAERSRLALAVEQSPESIVITDPQGRIEYVNPAFERITGYTRAEALGANPRLLKSGVQGPAFYEAMWNALTAGQSWVAEFVNRRKDGTLFEEEAVISPVRDAQGRTTSYVAVKRDVTHERATEAQASRLARERTLIADTISHLGARETPEAAAEAICRQVMSLTGLAMAGIFVFMLDERAVPLAILTAGGPPVPLRPLPYQRSRYLRERAETGPWVESWVDRPWHPYNEITLEAGVEEVAYAPLRHAGVLLGVLVASKLPTTEALISEEVPALVEFAGLAAVTLGPAVADRVEVAQVRDRVAAVISQEAFHPVFQPITDTLRGRIVAYEALTRFDDGAAPDLRFAEAEHVGLGLELEAATLAAALDAARHLPPRVRLHLNVSPTFVLAGDPLRSIVASANRRLVLEVTEHTVIDDYPAFRRALAALGRRVCLAVDDAGAGFASLRHILELSPTFVKLDRSVIGGIEADLAREAMVAGMRHFAQDTHCRLIAEGVETEAELRVLTEHGVRLVQGYLLGRPDSLPT